jgi:DNA modification methylase
VDRVIRLAVADLAAERLRDADDDVHFPTALVRAVLDEFTRPGELVLDPFAGFGTTLAVSEQMGRAAVGLELLPDRVALISRRVGPAVRIVEGDARRLDDYDIGTVDLCLTSPPYMAAAGHPWNPLTGYRTLDADYPTYLAQLGDVFAAVARHLRPGGHLVVNAATIWYQGRVTPLAWDIGRLLEALPGLSFCGETYLAWDEPPPWLRGDYCLVFEKDPAGHGVAGS